jgi:hypothetical protein
MPVPGDNRMGQEGGMDAKFQYFPMCHWEGGEIVVGGSGKKTSCNIVSLCTQYVHLVQ